MGNREGYPECSEEELFLLQLAWRELMCLAQREPPLLLQPPLLLPFLLLLKTAKINTAPGREMGLGERTKGEKGPEKVLEI